MEVWIVVSILTICMILFMRESLPVEIIAMLAVLALMITGILKPEEAFSGFSDPALITIAGVLVLSTGLMRTGVADWLGQRIENIAGGKPLNILLLFMLSTTLLSAFMNNVAATAVFLPIAVRLANKNGFHPGKFLMPLAFASMFGGTCTSIGTSTNMVMSTFLSRNQLPPFRLFEFTPIGILISIVGILYMISIGRRLLPERTQRTFEDSYRLREYVTELMILEDSPLAGKTIAESELSEKLNLSIIGLVRNGKKYLRIGPSRVLQARDLLLVEGRLDNILKVKDTLGVEIKPDFKLTGKELQDEETKLAEILIAPQSNLLGRSLKDVRFRQRYQLVALALHRKGQTVRERLSITPMELGDVLLVQGRQDDINALRSDPDFLILEDLPISRFKKRRARRAIIIFLAVLVAGGSGIVPVVVAVIAGAVLMIVARCIDLADAYQSISWPTIVLIAGMASMGIAMEQTGLASQLSKYLLGILGDFGPRVLLIALFLVTVLLSQPMSNAAAALLVAPIALSTATSLDLNPRTFIMTVALAASCSFMTPLEPACALVHSPGEYKFFDFARTGALLTLIMMLIVVAIVPILWPL